MSSAPTHHLVYDGYDPRWILGRDKGPPVVPKPKPPPPVAAAAPDSKPAAPPPPPEPDPVVLQVSFCCEGCVERMNDAFKDLDGLERVRVDPTSSTVTITGKVNVEACLKLARRIYKRSEVWPQK